MAHRAACPDADNDAGRAAVPETETPPREVDSRALFGRARVLAIRHGAEVYTLRVTRAGKLILTK